MNKHRIHRVAKLTGLSKDVIRVWERRYGLIQPERGANRYRLYTDEDVALLRFLRGQLDQGQSIGELASEGREKLLAQMQMQALPIKPEEPFDRLVGELVAALKPLDRAAFERRLNGAVAVIPFEEALHGILLPLQERVGELWHEGKIGVAIEHYVTKLVQQKLFAVMNQVPVVESGPKVVIGCPPEELHEIGALTVAYRCRVRGCRTYYLGADVPITDLVRLCREVEPELVLLSLTNVLDSDRVLALAQALSGNVAGVAPVVLGGTGAIAARGLLEREQLAVWTTMGELDSNLTRVFSRRGNAG